MDPSRFIEFTDTRTTKSSFVISIAGIFARGKDTNEKISYIKNFWTALIYTSTFAVLITLALKDMGTAIHYVLIAGFMLFLSDIPNKVLYPIFFGGLAVAPVLLSFLSKVLTGYKQHRIKVYLEGILHNNYDRVDAYQIYQSLIAFGTGGIFGKGIGNGVQSITIFLRWKRTLLLQILVKKQVLLE